MNAPTLTDTFQAAGKQDKEPHSEKGKRIGFRNGVQFDRVYAKR